MNRRNFLAGLLSVPIVAAAGLPDVDKTVKIKNSSVFGYVGRSFKYATSDEVMAATTHNTPMSPTYGRGLVPSITYVDANPFLLVREPL